MEDIWDLHPFKSYIKYISNKYPKLASIAEKIGNKEVGPILGGKPFIVKHKFELGEPYNGSWISSDRHNFINYPNLGIVDFRDRSIPFSGYEQGLFNTISE